MPSKAFPPILASGINANFPINGKLTINPNFKTDYIQVVIYEVSNKSNITNRSNYDLNCIAKNSDRFSGVKINLEGIASGTENFDFSIGSQTGLNCRLGFKAKCEPLNNPMICIKKLEVHPDIDFKINFCFDCNQIPRVTQDNKLSIQLNEVTFDEMYMGLFSLWMEYIENNNKCIKYFSLTEYKDKILDGIRKRISDFWINDSDEENLSEKQTIDLEENLIEGCDINLKLGDISISFFLEISNIIPLMQVNKKTYTEKGYCSTIPRLYLYSSECSNMPPIEYDYSYSKINAISEKIKGFLKVNSLEKDNLSKFLSEFRPLLIMTSHPVMYIYEYPSIIEVISIFNMFFLFANKLFAAIEKSSSEDEIISTLEIFKLIAQRDELSKEILDEIVEQVKEIDDFKENLNNFVINCIKLASCTKDKIKPTMCFSLAELYSILYTRSRMMKCLFLAAINEKSEVEKAAFSSSHKIINGTLRDYIKSINPKEQLSNISSKSFFYFSLVKAIVSRAIDDEIIDSFIAVIKTKKEISTYSYYLNEIASYLTENTKIITEIISERLKRTNAFDSYDVFATIDFIHQVISGCNLKKDTKLKCDYSLLQVAMEVIIKSGNAQTLTKILCLYYSDGHLMDTSHLHWVVEILKKNFYFLSFHWCWKVRMMFFKLFVYIISDRLISLGIYQELDEHFSLLRDKNKNAITKEISKLEEHKFCEVDVAIQEYFSVLIEYSGWVEKNKLSKYIEYPVIIINLPKEEDI